MALKRLLLSLLPPRMRMYARELRALSTPARRAYLVRALRRHGTGAAVDTMPELGPGRTILFVCHGNIIRSALAEALFRRHAQLAGCDVHHIRSAGVDATPGRPADPRATVAGVALGVRLDAHRSQRLTRELVDEAAVIYAMDRLNEAGVIARFPDAEGKVRRLGALAADITDGDMIPDPFDLDADAVAATAQRIDRATSALAVAVVTSLDRARAGRAPGLRGPAE